MPEEKEQKELEKKIEGKKKLKWYQFSSEGGWGTAIFLLIFVFPIGIFWTISMFFKGKIRVSIRWAGVVVFILNIVLTNYSTRFVQREYDKLTTDLNTYATEHNQVPDINSFKQMEATLISDNLLNPNPRDSFIARYGVTYKYCSYKQDPDIVSHYRSVGSTDLWETSSNWYILSIEPKAIIPWMWHGGSLHVGPQSDDTYSNTDWQCKPQE